MQCKILFQTQYFLCSLLCLLHCKCLRTIYKQIKNSSLILQKYYLILIFLNYVIIAHNHWSKLQLEMLFTRKYPLRGYCLAPLEGRGDRIPRRAELWNYGVTALRQRMDRQTWKLKQYFRLNKLRNFSKQKTYICNFCKRHNPYRRHNFFSAISLLISSKITGKKFQMITDKFMQKLLKIVIGMGQQT